MTDEQAANIQTLFANVIVSRRARDRASAAHTEAERLYKTCQSAYVKASLEAIGVTEGSIIADAYDHEYRVLGIGRVWVDLQIVAGAARRKLGRPITVALADMVNASGVFNWTTHSTPAIRNNGAVQEQPQQITEATR